MPEFLNLGYGILLIVSGIFLFIVFSFFFAMWFIAYIRYARKKMKGLDTPKFRTTTLVYIWIPGEDKKTIKLKTDLVTDLLTDQKEGIQPFAKIAGDGIYCEKDADKIKKWLRKHGAVEIKSNANGL